MGFFLFASFMHSFSRSAKTTLTFPRQVCCGISSVEANSLQSNMLDYSDAIDMSWNQPGSFVASEEREKENKSVMCSLSLLSTHQCVCAAHSASETAVRTTCCGCSHIKFKLWV